MTPHKPSQFHRLLRYRSRLVNDNTPRRTYLKPSLSDTSMNYHQQRTRVMVCFAAAALESQCLVSSRQRNGSGFQLLQQYRQNLRYGGYAYDEYEHDSAGCDVNSNQQNLAPASILDNSDEWERKLTTLLGNIEEQEVVSREKKDRRDYEKIAEMASRMGLNSRQYSKYVVVSKVALPNYRPDLDDKRPQRQVILPLALQKVVENHLREYIIEKPRGKEFFSDRASNAGAIASSEGPNQQQEPLIQPSPEMESLLLRRSLAIRKQQQEWQESVEGKRMLEFRKSLPAYKEREMFLKTISDNQVVVVSGETGCGKTTQLPQYILESEIEAARWAGCSIVCTQPRRISAMSVSERIAVERGEKLGESVGYKVRLEGTSGRDTHLLFCTTGVLLRKLLGDRNLNGVSHVIVDEIHERGKNEDFLLIVLKDLISRRPDLKLILMSATMNAELFSSYFGGAPMMHIHGFTYPVRTHFLENILELTGHRLTQFNQIDDYGRGVTWKMQRHATTKRRTQMASVVEDALKVADFREYSRHVRESLSCWNPDLIGFNLIEHTLCHIVNKERSGAVLVFMTGWDDINSLKVQLQAHPVLGDPGRVRLLAGHGSMSSEEQRIIFDKPEDGIRKIVLATNMAETSITINDVVFVVDCGKAKESSYDALNNTPCLLPTWVSKAAAHQRRGRAGRVQPGECYHLYPRCVYDALSDYQLPELLRTPLQSLCLQIKSLQFGSISEFLSRALQSPEPLSVQNAVENLKTIGALDENENLTVLGHHLSVLPVEPKLGKMLILGAIFKCLDPIMTVVAGLSTRDPFLMPVGKQASSQCAKSMFSGREFSDHLTLVRAYEGWKEAERKQSGHEYCWKNFLSGQTLKSIDSLRMQFYSLLKDANLVDNNAVISYKWSHDGNFIRSIICAGLFPDICSVVNKEKSIALKTMEDGEVLLHMSSVNGTQPRIPYPWLVFNEKLKVTSIFLRDTTAVSDSSLLLFGGNISRGSPDGHLKMLGGYLEFSMEPAVADTYLNLKKELDELIQNKLLNPKMDMSAHNKLLSAVRLLVAADRCGGQFVINGEVQLPPQKTALWNVTGGRFGFKGEAELMGQRRKPSSPRTQGVTGFRKTKGSMSKLLMMSKSIVLKNE